MVFLAVSLTVLIYMSYLVL